MIHEFLIRNENIKLHNLKFTSKAYLLCSLYVTLITSTTRTMFTWIFIRFSFEYKVYMYFPICDLYNK